MGPAYLLDVVGMDTAYHVAHVLAEGYPDRMASEELTALHFMYDNERFGQKNSIGFYQYSIDRKGKPKKATDDGVPALLIEVMPNGPQDISEEEIVDRMMIPMIIETARCLEDGIVDTVNEADMGLIFGLGFPHPWWPLRYADTEDSQQS